MGSSKKQRVFNQNFALLIKNCALIDHSDRKKAKNNQTKNYKNKNSIGPPSSATQAPNRLRNASTALSMEFCGNFSHSSTMAAFSRSIFSKLRPRQTFFSKISQIRQSIGFKSGLEGGHSFGRMKFFYQTQWLLQNLLKCVSFLEMKF